MTSKPEQLESQRTQSELVTEPRCHICQSKFRKQIDALLRDDRYTLQEILAIVNTINANSGVTFSIASIKRHKTRHLVDKGIASGLAGYDPEQETLVPIDEIMESMMYALAPLSPEEYDRLDIHYNDKLREFGATRIQPPLWTVERFARVWLGMVKESIPECYLDVRKRFFEFCKERYPNNYLQLSD